MTDIESLTLELTDDERETLRGDHGATLQKIMEPVVRYAEALGLMFQAVDDLLDVTSTTGELGKAAQKDADRGKLTYPGVLGVQGTRDQIARMRAQAHADLEDFDRRADPLRDLCDYLAVRQK